MSHTPSPDSLDDVAAHFARWRERRCAPGGRIPAPLRAMACRLLERVPLEVVAQACAVAPATLDRWRTPDAAVAHRADGALSSAFVALPAPSACAAMPVDAATASTPTLTVERPDGLRLRLHGALDVTTLTVLLDAGALR